MSNEKTETKRAPAKKNGVLQKIVNAITLIPRKIWGAIQNTAAELRKVTWPDRKSLISYTSIVLAFMLLMAVVVGLLDLGATNLMKLIIGI
ncbi:MAG: preprotein translocase subunit SecE [Clostridia bacterium]|nr:preprotein translocase subunit SecE [Clostridia bacterium]